MKTLKSLLLLAILALTLNAGAQEVEVNITENTSYSGLYEVNLYVLDTYTHNACLVAQEKNVSIPGHTFIYSEINLTCVNIVSDQVDRYRYIADVARQSAQGSGQNWTPLLDTGEMWSDYTIYVTLY